MKYTTEKQGDYMTWYRITEPNAKGETILIQIVECKNHGGKNALPVLWKKNGYMNRVLDTYLSVNTYCTDTEGMCWGRYNPQHKLSDDGKRNVINFDWMFENTEENKQKLISECIRLFESAEGKTATQEKMEKIETYAKEHNLEIVYEKQDGWRELMGIYSPKGSVVITNQKSLLDKDYKKALFVY